MPDGDERSTALRERLRAAAASREGTATEAERPERPDDVITIGGPVEPDDFLDEEDLEEEFDDEELSDEEREFEEMFDEGDLDDLLDEY